MDGTETLIAAMVDETEAAPRSCPRCQEPQTSSAPVTTFLFGSFQLRRCHRCGARHGVDGRHTRWLLTCSGCGLPFIVDKKLSEKAQRCDDCRAGRSSIDLPDRELAAATEAEVLAALGERWTFVTSPALAGYLEGVTRRAARRIEGAPESGRVLLIEDWSMGSLALPSGALLISLGMLAGLEDEAELAFVLAHELAHATSGEAAVRLVRQGFHAVARAGEAGAGEAWSRAALDMVKLGYGHDREREADSKALEAVLALGYDAESVMRWLRRMERRVAQGDPQIRDYAFAHPTPSDRRRELDRALFGRVAPGSVGRVNREVFRRAAGRTALTSGLVPVLPGKEQDGSPVSVGGWSLLRSQPFWVASVLLLLAALLIVLSLT